MHREEFRNVVVDAVRQSLTDGHIDVSAVPNEQLQELIGAIADGVFAGLEATLDENMTKFELPPASTAAVAASAAAATATATESAPALEGEKGAIPHTLEPAAAAAAIVPPASVSEEQLLWRGRPYLTVGTVYELTTQRLRVLRGIVGNNIEEVELVRVRDTRLSQTASERMFDIGDITIYSTDTSTPEKVLWNVREPLKVRELLRKAVQVERDRRRMFYREDMVDSSHPDDQDDAHTDSFDSHL